MRKLWVSLVILLGTFVVVVGGTAAYATSPASNYYYPQSPEGGLGTSLYVHYQIVGTGQYVNYFSRTVQNVTDLRGFFYARMCGPTFGCAWTAHNLPVGTTWNGTLVENRNMTKAGYESCVWVPGWSPSCREYSVL